MLSLFLAALLALAYTLVVARATVVAPGGLGVRPAQHTCEMCGRTGSFVRDCTYHGGGLVMCTGAGHRACSEIIRSTPFGFQPDEVRPAHVDEPILSIGWRDEADRSYAERLYWDRERERGGFAPIPYVGCEDIPF